MAAYSLRPDETILYERDVTIQGQERSSRLMLTNLNIVITEYVKSSLFAKEEETHTVYSVQDIKIYEDLPQVLQKGKHIRILFLYQEISLDFNSLIEANKFRMTLFKLVTGKTAPARSAKKVKNAIEIIDDTLGIDTVGTTKAVLEGGVIGTLVSVTGKKKTGSKRSRSRSKSGKAIDALAAVAGGVVMQNITNESEQPALPEKTALSHDEQIVTLKQFKELFDAGIITEEEFEEKKKEILGK
ncbi:MAG: hypothetical protein GX991_07020 [Clostridiaceae bacterium]|nr:hypothetical protein [Clostridiaceae bacterium]